jgi:SPP1 family predicted phage head-tail adaptor
MTFNPQELNQRITLQQKFSSVNPQTGIRSDEWQDRQDLWAKAEPAVGRTRFAAAAAGFVDPVDFTVRYIEVEGDSGDQGTIPFRPGDWRVVWRGYAYEVQSIIDNKGKRREMVIATEGSGEAVA